MMDLKEIISVLYPLYRGLSSFIKMGYYEEIVEGFFIITCL